MTGEPAPEESYLGKAKRALKEKPLTIGLVLLAVMAFVVWDEFGAGLQPQQNQQTFQQSNQQPFQQQPPVANQGQVDPNLTPVDLPIENLRQETQVWCWAAVSQQIIAASRGIQQTPPQCALVAMANGANADFCCQGQNPQCVTTGSLQQIQGLIQQFGGRTSSYAEPTDAMTLYRTLKMGHAVIIGIDAGQGMGHVVVARGMSFQQTPQGVVALVHINDPMAHFTQPVPFNQVAAVWRQAIIVN